MPDLRASDADRERSVAALRHHAAVGRLTVDELDERSERALAATTLRELAALHEDLPALTPQPAAPRERRRLPRVPGRLPFTFRWRAATTTPVAMAELLAHAVPPLQARGWQLVERSSDRLHLQSSRRPAWTIAPAILLFPLGLLFLLHKVSDHIWIDVAEDERGTVVVASGSAALEVRRGFAELED